MWPLRVNDAAGQLSFLCNCATWTNEISANSKDSICFQRGEKVGVHLKGMVGFRWMHTNRSAKACWTCWTRLKRIVRSGEASRNCSWLGIGKPKKGKLVPPHF